MMLLCQRAIRQCACPQFFRVFVLWLAVFSSLTASGATTLADRMAGTNIPDFSIVYICKRHNKLQNATRDQIAAQVHQRYKSLTPKARQTAPPDIVKQKTDEIVTAIQFDKQESRVILTISKRGNKLLITKDAPERQEVTVVVYDGARTMSMVRGSDAMINPGFQFVNLRDFVFPGFGMCGIPLGRGMVQESSDANSFRGEVAMADGWAGASGLPDYRSGQIKTSRFGGVDCIIETDAGWPFPAGFRGPNGKQPTAAEQVAFCAKLGVPRIACSYSGYRAVGQDLWLPARIHLSEFYRPGSVLPYGEQYTADYTLQSASLRPPDEKEFAFESQLTKGGAVVVQDNSKKKPVGIRYVPGKTLEQQFAEDRIRHP